MARDTALANVLQQRIDAAESLILLIDSGKLDHEKRRHNPRTLKDMAEDMGRPVVQLRYYDAIIEDTCDLDILPRDGTSRKSGIIGPTIKARRAVLVAYLEGKRRQLAEVQGLVSRTETYENGISPNDQQLLDSLTIFTP